MEASGTSGMKAAANGALNLSIPDGWWIEGYNGANGWSIGLGESYEDQEYQDFVESRALYDLLEKEIVPTFYSRTAGIPRDWISLMKESIQTLASVFNTNRMVQEYSERFYFPCSDNRRKIEENNWEVSRSLAEYRDLLKSEWNHINIVSTEWERNGGLKVGDDFKITVNVDLGKIHPTEVDVQLYCGQADSMDNLPSGKVISLSYSHALENGHNQFVGKVSCKSSGRYAFAPRIIPKNPNIHDPLRWGFVHWG